MNLMCFPCQKKMENGSEIDKKNIKKFKDFLINLFHLSQSEQGK